MSIVALGTCDRRDDGADDEVVGAGGQVVIASSLVGVHGAHVVVGAERDDRLRRMHAQVQLPGAQLAQQSETLSWVLELAEHEHVDRVDGDLRAGVLAAALAA